ncbi:MAG: methyl-accepting chemotaxis protein [Cypionkella sp.]
MALGAMFVTARSTSSFRYLAVSVLMGQVMALLIAMRGSPLQTDMHMAFFAAMAICALMYDVRAIMLGAALVAVHHLLLGMFMDELVFYGGAGFGRIALHAGILVVETVGLAWMTFNTLTMMGIAERSSDQARASATVAESLTVEIQATTADHQRQHASMMAQLGEDFGTVVAAAVNGDFSRRIEREYGDAELNSLAKGVNELVVTVERGLGETGTVLDALAHTDLTKRVDGEYSGAFDQLKCNTNAVAEKLSEVVGTIKQTSRGLKSATGEILAGANDLSERTTRQAATIEETGGAMEGLAGIVATNSAQARSASTVSASLAGNALEGGGVMDKASLAMEQINTSSRQISNIIGLIDDIAFQTNLLALNASVEAARAGDAGKGFAVVAVEVRRLAQSAAKASAEVKIVIERSAAEVRNGTGLVSVAAEMLQKIVLEARQSDELVSTIAEASRAQAIAIEDVTASVRGLDEMTQHNAALVEQINAAIEQTESQASELDNVVDVFIVSSRTLAVERKASMPARKPAQAGKVPAKMYATAGNAAISSDWDEF